MSSDVQRLSILSETMDEIAKHCEAVQIMEDHYDRFDPVKVNQCIEKITNLIDDALVINNGEILPVKTLNNLVSSKQRLCIGHTVSVD